MPDDLKREEIYFAAATRERDFFQHGGREFALRALTVLATINTGAIALIATAIPSIYATGGVNQGDVVARLMLPCGLFIAALVMTFVSAWRGYRHQLAVSELFPGPWQVHDALWPGGSPTPPARPSPIVDGLGRQTRIAFLERQAVGAAVLAVILFAAGAYLLVDALAEPWPAGR